MKTRHGRGWRGWVGVGMLLGAGLGLGGNLAWGGTLVREQVAAEAKWLLHVDLENLQTTRLGQYLGTELMDKKLAKPAADVKAFIDFDFDWRRITALTAYGTDYQAPERAKGVMLVTTDLDFRKAMEALLTKQAEMGRVNGASIERVEPDPQPVYLLNDDLYVAVVPGKPTILGKSKRQVLQAREVLNGSAANLAASTTFQDYPPTGANFFFMSLAEGFNDSTPVPPQARVLKMADSLRMLVGESGDQVTCSMVLRAKTVEVSQQIQQIIQGMIALVTLSQTDNRDLQQLAQALKVTVNDRLVTVEMIFPVARAIEKVAQREGRKARP